jgi:hypothetical protein
MDTTIQRPLETPAPEISVATEEQEYRRDVFLSAAEIMERDGYATGTKAMATSGPVCLLGAVGRAIGARAVINQPIYDFDQGGCEIIVSPTSYDYLTTGAFVCERPAIADELDPFIIQIWRFSDGRGKEAVVRALRAMANGKTFEEATSGNA